MWLQNMLDAGIEPSAASFSSIMDAYAKVSNVDRAEYWLTQMFRAGVAPEVVSYSAVINACGQAGQTERARRVFKQMEAHGVQANSVTYTSLARPYARAGDYVEVEKIRDDMISKGIAMNEYFLTALLTAYTHAQPRQPERAEIALRDARRAGIRMNEFVITSFKCCVGEDRYMQVQSELGLGTPKSRPNAHSSYSEGGYRDQNGRHRQPRQQRH